MEKERLEKIFQELASGARSVADALEACKRLGFEDLGFAKIDHHRALRRGAPEVIFCPRKTTEQIVQIMARQVASDETVLGTRADPETLAEIARRFPETERDEAGRCFFRPSSAWRLADADAPRPVIVCAGTSDLPVAREARLTLRALGYDAPLVCDVGVAGLHRLYAHRELLATAAVLIAIAGMEGALPSVLTGLVSCPVIGVPTSVGYGAHLGGLAPLLAMLNSCASGLTVVNIDNGFGAAYAAALMLRTGERHGRRS